MSSPDYQYEIHTDLVHLHSVITDGLLHSQPSSFLINGETSTSSSTVILDDVAFYLTGIVGGTAVVISGPEHLHVGVDCHIMLDIG